MAVKRVFFLTLVFILGACAATQNPPPVAEIEQPPCPDGAEAWSLYLKAAIDPLVGDAAHFRACAARAGHVEAMAEHGTQLTQWPGKQGDFEQGMDFLRKAAVAGNDAAQRQLALKYETGRSAAGKVWIGRNAYLALFWHGVVHRDAPAEGSVPQASDLLERFRNQLSEQTQQSLSGLVAAWRPGRPEPQNFTFDILMTNVIAGPAGRSVRSERGTANAVLDHGMAAGLPDSGLLALFRGFSGDVDRVPEDLLDRLVARGSFLALTLKLRNLNAKNEDGRDRAREESVLILQLLSRLGLDVRYLQPHHDTLLSRFSESGDVDQLMRSIVAASRPERQILATIAAMNACSAESARLCEPTLSKLKPLITPAALNFLVFIRAMEACRVPAEKMSCLLGNGGLTALRDIIVNDTVDLSGRSV